MKNETKWSVDLAHSEIDFKVRHMMIAHVKGSFSSFDASIYTTEKDFTTAQIDLWIDAATLNTGNDQRDEHLKGNDFLQVEKFPQITFTSSTIGAADENGVHVLWGELTMRGITRNVHFDVAFGGIVQDPWGKERAGFTITGKFNRVEWELTWNTALEAGGIMVGEEISISCEIELVNLGINNLNMDLKSSTEVETVF